MAGIKDFAILDLHYKASTWKPYTPPKPVGEPMFRMPTAKDITLAEYDPSSQGAITAHRLKDYRRKSFSLTLLPSVRTVLDDRFSPLVIPDGKLLTT